MPRSSGYSVLCSNSALLLSTKFSCSRLNARGLTPTVVLLCCHAHSTRYSFSNIKSALAFRIRYSQTSIYHTMAHAPMYTVTQTSYSTNLNNSILDPLVLRPPPGDTSLVAPNSKQQQQPPAHAGKPGTTNLNKQLENSKYNNLTGQQIVDGVGNYL